MTVADLDVRAMPDDGLLSLYRSDERAAAAALAEAARRDRADRAARQREQLRSEWYDAAYQQFLQAESVCRGNLLSREGLAAGIADPFSLWHGPAAVADRYASEELRDLWAISPRITITEYARRTATGNRMAREDITEEAGHGDQVDTDRRPTVGVDGPGAVRHDRGAGAGQPVRPDRGAREGGTGPATGPIQRGGRVNAIMDAERMAARVEQARTVRAAERRQQAGQDAGTVRAPQGGSVALRAPQTVMAARELDGAQLLKDTYVALNHFAIWPSESALVTAVLFSAAVHGRDDKCMPVWQYAPHLLITSEEGGSGKSWMGRLISKLSPDGETLIEPTKASLIQMISERKTVTITEADVLFGAGGRNRGLVGVLNAMYEPDRCHTRMRGRQAERVPLFGSAVLDGLESLIKSTGPDLKTLVSRCIIIKVRRGPEGYRPPRFDKTARAVFARGGEKLAQWMAQQVRAGIGDVVPEVPEGLGNRPCALWEPLFAVADAAGGTWPARARQACADLESAAEVDEDDEQEDEYRAALSEWADEPVFTAAEEA